MSLLNVCFNTKIQRNYLWNQQNTSFIQAWDWILIYSKTKSKIFSENTKNFIAKTDINWLKNGFSMKLIKIQFLEVPLCWFMRKEDILSFRGFYLEGVWLWRISGGYSQEMMWLVLAELSIHMFAMKCFWEWKDI